MGFKQVIPPDKKYMEELVPVFWEFVKEDFSPENMVKFGSEKGIYIYKRPFSREGEENRILQLKMEFVEFEEEEINNKRKD